MAGGCGRRRMNRAAIPFNSRCLPNQRIHDHLRSTQPRSERIRGSKSRPTSKKSVTPEPLTPDAGEVTKSEADAVMLVGKAWRHSPMNRSHTSGVALYLMGS